MDMEEISQTSRFKSIGLFPKTISLKYHIKIPLR